ncbi:hypothetical protein CTheo_2395 [Ceratobasidium theobromae]|uniref:Uncharacterized protein n=1 Tax=Ceratobasidium theobromae TaxID=1582974 RepID=A0A5N5QRA6_9AGAM|nr:hypothetical protein CTheo_2395 [Ceratobasidium theobromae]
MSFVPSQMASNSAIHWSRGDRPSGPVPLDFSSGWGKGIVFDWYKRMPTTSILNIQLRKEFKGPFHHEFILILLQGGLRCRLDRRGDPDVPTQTLSEAGSDAHDTVQEVDTTSLNEIHSTSECLVELRPNGKIDLSFILSVCFSIRSDPKTQRYTLQRFNCYFFSWTIASVVARHSVSWDTPAGQFTTPEQLALVLKKKAIEPIAANISKIGMKCIPVVFLSMQQHRLRQILRKHHRPMGFIPISVMRMMMSIWVSQYMRPRMESITRGVIESAMASTLQSAIESLIDSRSSSVMRTALSHTLWFDATRDALRAAAQTALRDAICALMVKTLMSVSGSDSPANDIDRVPNPTSTNNQSAPPQANPKSELASTVKKPKALRVGGALDHLFVSGAAAIADTSYDSGIFFAQSAWGLTRDLARNTETREDWVAGWDTLWTTVMNQAREDGRAVLSEVARTQPPNAARDEIWNVVWEDYELGFRESGPIVRDCMWDSIQYATETIVDVVSTIVFGALEETSQYPLKTLLNRSVSQIPAFNLIHNQLTYLKPGQGKLERNPHWVDANHTQLQDWIKHRIQKHGDQMRRLSLGSASTIQDDIRQAMGRVWDHVSKTEKSNTISQDAQLQPQML